MKNNLSNKFKVKKDLIIVKEYIEIIFNSLVNFINKNKKKTLNINRKTPLNIMY